METTPDRNLGVARASKRKMTESAFPAAAAASNALISCGWQPEIRRGKPVEGKVVDLPLFNTGF